MYKRLMPSNILCSCTVYVQPIFGCRIVTNYVITTHSFFGPAVYMRIKQHIFTYLLLKGQIGKFTVFVIVLSAEILITCINQASLMHTVILECTYKIVREYC
jgi:hypothetical protein